MAECLERVTNNGIQVIRLENDVMSVSLVPEAGGKISEIVDRRTDRNWLWGNPHLPVRRSAAFHDYNSNLDSGGWDEVLFSVAPCGIKLDNGEEYAVPDHGDLVRRAWTIASATVSESGHAICDLTTEGDALSYHWRRVASLHPHEPVLNLSYALENTDEISLPFFWCAHPLFAVDHSLSIELPNDQPYLIDHTAGVRVSPADGDYEWPILPLSDGDSIELGSLPSAINFAAKIFVRSRSPGAISIHATESNDCLTIKYDQNKFPWVGLWINNRGWSGIDAEPYLNLGVEPSTAPCDSFAAALAQGWAEYLKPGEVRAWSLDVALLP